MSSPIDISQIISQMLNLVLSIMPTIIQVAVFALALKMLVSAFAPVRRG